MFTENIDDAVMFDNRHDAENAASRLLPDSFCVKNVVCVDDEKGVHDVPK